ncbi:hypothetical protein [Zhihengliuella flava]|uniref:Uncharacterized protein n=1 Tax=Zhihengliuella flava TaxID=1285193 RepID=A0A931DE75_9MICC|nr:hypothetical protein [Zhihengliuella flava]MBG6085841.1 hypothetical protein [Zhihengliuella flava]
MTDKDGRPYIKISLDYLDNPKIDALSDTAILLHLSLLLRAGQQKRDGIVSTRACKTRGDKPFKELVTQGLLHKIDNMTYQLHDYVKHQTEAQVIKNKHEVRQSAGARGGHVKNHINRLIYDEACQHCNNDFETKADWLQHPDLTAKTPKHEWQK